MKQLFRRHLARHIARRRDVPDIPLALERASRAGFAPELVSDVGAYRGEFASLCLGLWPAASVACFEPQPDRRADLDALAAASNGRVTVFSTLVGAREDEHVTFNVAETASSVLVESAGVRHPQAELPMLTLDRVVSERFAGRAPDLLKIDVQGYELEVLRGAERSLAGVRMILAELNLLDIHAGVPLLSEIVAWLEARDFVAYDVCGLTRRPLDQALWQMDLLFVPRASPLRSDKRWGR